MAHGAERLGAIWRHSPFNIEPANENGSQVIHDGLHHHPSILPRHSATYLECLHQAALGPLLANGPGCQIWEPRSRLPGAVRVEQDEFGGLRERQP